MGVVHPAQYYLARLGGRGVEPVVVCLSPLTIDSTAQILDITENGEILPQGHPQNLLITACIQITKPLRIHHLREMETSS